MNRLFYNLKSYLFQQLHKKDIILLKKSLDDIYLSINDISALYFNLTKENRKFIYNFSKIQFEKHNHSFTTWIASSLLPFSFTINTYPLFLDIKNNKYHDYNKNKYLPNSIYLNDLLSYNTQIYLSNNEKCTKPLWLYFHLSYNTLQECIVFIAYAKEELKKINRIVSLFTDINKGLQINYHNDYEMLWQYMVCIDDHTSEQLFSQYMIEIYNHSKQGHCQCYQNQVMDLQLYYDNFWSMQCIPEQFKQFIDNSMQWEKLLYNRLEFLKHIDKHEQYQHLNNIIPNKSIINEKEKKKKI